MAGHNRVSLTLTPEQREMIKKACGKDAGAIEFTAEELEERIAPMRSRFGIDTVPLPD